MRPVFGGRRVLSVGWMLGVETGGGTASLDCKVTAQREDKNRPIPKENGLDLVYPMHNIDI